uniref:Uncharacterized protein n=1 Tax=Timema shepardi TaxID=629360 RepID=A0A7R9AUS2_TIMSH|nr:unnamed protein product [Timema shepardi]
MHQPSRKIAINNAGYSCLPSRAKLDLVPGSTHNLSNLAPHRLETSPECNRDDSFSKCHTFFGFLHSSPANITNVLFPPPPSPNFIKPMLLVCVSATSIHSMNPHQHLPGNTSPTSDQLARWFSPELLAQARAGNLPDMPPVPSSSNMLSLEELERLQQASAAVHN